jgi:hypothetical protein
MRNAVHYLADNTSQTWIETSAGFAPGKAASGTDLVVVIDYAQETHVPVTLPLVRGPDAARLRRRRLEREFPNVRLCAVLPVRNRPGDGLSDAVMVAAGTDDAGGQQLAQLGETHALRCITTPALLVAEWLRHAKLTRRRLLVVMPTPAGLRVTFIDHGQPLLSRLTSVISQGGSATEISRTVQYLQNTQRIERSEQLEIWFWGMTHDEVELCRPSGVAYSVGATPKVRGLPNPQRDGLTALLQLAARRSPRAQLAPDGLRLNWFARELRRYAYGTAVCIAVAGVVAMGLLQWRTHGLVIESAAVETQITAMAADRSQLEQTMSQHGVKFEDLRLLPDIEQALLSTAVNVDEAFKVAGRAFGTRPEILLQSLEFFSAPPAPPPAGTERSCGNESIPQSASADVRFSLAGDLDVRRRAEELTYVRTAMTSLDHWHSTPASSRVGAGEAVTVKAGMDASADSSEWAACLQREGTS